MSREGGDRDATVFPAAGAQFPSVIDPKRDKIFSLGENEFWTHLLILNFGKFADIV